MKLSILWLVHTCPGITLAEVLDMDYLSLDDLMDHNSQMVAMRKQEQIIDEQTVNAASWGSADPLKERIEQLKDLAGRAPEEKTAENLNKLRGWLSKKKPGKKAKR